jgi:hypothetical protein
MRSNSGMAGAASGASTLTPSALTIWLMTSQLE